MPDVQNVFRRGAAYWWRRSLSWADGNSDPIMLSLSLGTKDLGVARRRAAAMTAQSEAVRMSLYERVAREGLNAAERDAVLRAELRDYRDGLRQLTAEWQFEPGWAKVTNVDADLLVYETIWSAFAKTGVVDGAPSIDYADRHFAALDDEQRVAARRLLGSTQIRSALQADATMRLQTLGIEPNATNVALACRLILDARAQASREVRLGKPANAEPAAEQTRRPRAEASVVVSKPAPSGGTIDESDVPEKRSKLTPLKRQSCLSAETRPCSSTGSKASAPGPPSGSRPCVRSTGSGPPSETHEPGWIGCGRSALVDLHLRGCGRSGPLVRQAPGDLWEISVRLLRVAGELADVQRRVADKDGGRDASSVIRSVENSSIIDLPASGRRGASR